jgi:hypothetical protein
MIFLDSLPQNSDMLVSPSTNHHEGDIEMAKGMDQKKDTKKKPEKTLKEKRADKAAKKGR